MNARHTDAGRIDRDHYETSPSCGAFEIAEVYGCPDAHTADARAVEGRTADKIAAVSRADRPERYRRKHAFEVSS